MRRAERLTPERERDLVIAAGAGDPEACRALVEAFLPAIGGLARRFPGGIGVDRPELVQEGVAGLLFAARRYDAGLGTPFWAYATFWVRKAMQELVAELTRPVALSDRAVRGLAHLRQARSDHLRIHGAEPTLAELSAATRLTPAQLESLRALERTPRAIEQPLQSSGDGAATVGDAIADPLAELAYDQVLDHLELHAVHDSVGRLEERERMVIRAHYGLGQPAQSLKEIGGSLGLTGERARQIEAGALSKLRAALAHTAPDARLAPDGPAAY
jgi:RNA polymerase primary sigma factor